MASGDDETGYISVGLLARGGMGDVELGLRRTGSFHRLVAIKRLRAEHRDDPSFRRMFLDEAKIAGLIRHPNVVSVLDVGTDARGPFLVMDFVESVTASRLIQTLAQRGELLPVQLALRIAHQIALGLDAAHNLSGPGGESLGVIHRDISPQNILLGFDGAARLTDFGIAKASGQSQQKTTTGLLKGKVGYMAPEQLRFERPTQRSDLFSLGVVLFELLSAKRLYKGIDTIEVAQRVLSEPVPDIYAIRDDVSSALVELLFEVLAKDPTSRPASAREIAQRLSTMIDECVGEEGTLPLDELLTARFTEERTRIRERSSSMVRDWEARTEHSPAPPSSRARRRARIAVVSAVSMAVVIALGVALHGWLEDDTATATNTAIATDSNTDSDTNTNTNTDTDTDTATHTTAAAAPSPLALTLTAADDEDAGADSLSVEAVVEVGHAKRPTKRRGGRPGMSRANGETIRALDHAVAF